MNDTERKTIKKIAQRLTKSLDLTADLSEDAWNELNAALGQMDVPTWREIENLRNALNTVSKGRGLQ